MDEAEKAKLEELTEELEKIRGRHTELVTVYIPAGQNINTVSHQLESEKSTAKNIKSTSTRKNVLDALEKIIRYLKDFKKTPDNGLAIFSGNVSRVEGQQDIQLWYIEPPLPLKTRIYRCDKEFVLDALREMLEVKEIFGLLVMDRKEATIGQLVGKRIEVLQKMTSGVPSKVRAGGQCLSSDMIVETKEGIIRIADINIGDEIKALDIDSNKVIFTKCVNKWKKEKENYLEIVLIDWPVISSLEHVFFKQDNKKISEVLAKDILKGDLLINCSEDKLKLIEVKDIITINKKIEMFDIETESKNFFANGVLVHNSSQRFHRITEGLTREFYKRISEEMKKNFFEMKNLKGILVGGPVPTKDEFLDGDYLTTKLKEKIIGRVDIGDADESGLKELVTKSQDILAQQEIIYEKKLLNKFFEVLGAKPEKSAYGYENVKKALELGAVETLILSKKIDKKISKELTKMAESISSKIEIVSVDTDEGRQFHNLSGIGAILRFAVR